MGDPLSIAAGCIGVLTAAAQVSSVVMKFTNEVKSAPKQARVILTEVSHISGILTQLQPLILRENSVASSGADFLHVDQVVTIVSGCVMTFSELQELLNDLKSENMTIIDRVKWSRKETLIGSLIQRLQTHKASLSLMLTILNCNSVMEAKSSIDELCSSVKHCYQEMSQRLQALEHSGLDQEYEDQKGGETILPIRNTGERLSMLAASVRDPIGYDLREPEHDFTKDLANSRVYAKPRVWRDSVSSLRTGSHTTSWSILSGLSLAAVSDVTVISLLITKEEVYCPYQYYLSSPADGEAGLPTSPPTQLIRTSHQVPSDPSPRQSAENLTALDTWAQSQGLQHSKRSPTPWTHSILNKQGRLEISLSIGSDGTRMFLIKPLSSKTGSAKIQPSFHDLSVDPISIRRARQYSLTAFTLDQTRWIPCLLLFELPGEPVTNPLEKHQCLFGNRSGKVMKLLNEHADIMAPTPMPMKKVKLSSLINEISSYSFYHRNNIRYTWYITKQRGLFPETECQAELVTDGDFWRLEATMQWTQHPQAVDWSKAVSNSWIQFVNPELIKRGVDIIDDIVAAGLRLLLEYYICAGGLG